jgi:hypothetical protein
MNNCRPTSGNQSCLEHSLIDPLELIRGVERLFAAVIGDEGNVLQVHRLHAQLSEALQPGHFKLEVDPVTTGCRVKLRPEIHRNLALVPLEGRITLPNKLVKILWLLKTVIGLDSLQTWA